MEATKCSRCGAFYVGNGNVCPKCTGKDNFEFSTFINYVEKNGTEKLSLNQVSISTGISEKNLNRFLNYEGFEKHQKLFQ